MHRTATCNCGQLQLVCTGDPIRVAICHCHACQRRTGNVFGTQARFARAQVSITGSARTYDNVGDSGGHAAMHFCGTCGSTVYWTPDALPDHIIVAVGAFADADFPAPTFSVYGDRKHRWVELPDGIEAHR